MSRQNGRDSADVDPNIAWSDVPYGSFIRVRNRRYVAGAGTKTISAPVAWCTVLSVEVTRPETLRMTVLIPWSCSAST